MKKMKILLSTTMALILTISVQAQRNTERMKTMQIAFITEEIDLTPKQAESFWPIHNEGTNRIEDIRMQLQNVDNDVDAYFRLEEELATSRLDMMKSLRTVISDDQLMKYVKAKEKFKKRVLNQIKQNRVKRRRKGK